MWYLLNQEASIDNKLINEKLKYYNLKLNKNDILKKIKKFLPEKKICRVAGCRGTCNKVPGDRYYPIIVAKGAYPEHQSIGSNSHIHRATWDSDSNRHRHQHTIPCACHRRHLCHSKSRPYSRPTLARRPFARRAGSKPPATWRPSATPRPRYSPRRRYWSRPMATR